MKMKGLWVKMFVVSSVFAILVAHNLLGLVKQWGRVIVSDPLKTIYFNTEK